MIKIKTIHLKLNNNKAFTNDLVYLEEKEDLQFIIDYDLQQNDELFYSIGDKLHKIESNQFVLTYDEVFNNLQLKLTLKTKTSLYPVIYVLEDFKVNGVKVIGHTIDEKYPQIIRILFEENEVLRKAVIELHDEFKKLNKNIEELKKVGVKEYE